MSRPAVGDLAPAFEVNDTEGQKLTLAELVARGPVVLAFFPKAFTPGCRRELTSYATSYQTFIDRGAKVIAVSGDGEDTQARFRSELGADYSFVADKGASLIKQYGVKVPLVPYAKRVTFVIGKDRRVLAVEAGRDALDPSRAAQACASYE